MIQQLIIKEMLKAVIISEAGYMNATTLKIIGIITMTIDHIGYILFPQFVILRIIGRMAFPIFAYMIAEGCNYTKNKEKYFFSVFGTGLICSTAMYITEKNLYQSILITFACSIALIFAVEKIRRQTDGTQSKDKVIWVLIALGLIIAYYSLFQLKIIHGLKTDYGFYGIITPVLVWLGSGKQEKLLALALGLFLISIDTGGIQIFSFAALAILYLYNGERGKKAAKGFFYFYYPTHLAILYGIAQLIYK